VAKLLFARDAGHSALLHDSNQAIFRNTSRHPCHQLGGTNGLAFDAAGRDPYPKKKEKK
jgi:hypothetical protein